MLYAITNNTTKVSKISLTLALHEITSLFLCNQMSTYDSVFGFPFLKIFSHILLESGLLTGNFGRMCWCTFNTHYSFALWTGEFFEPVGHKTNSWSIGERTSYSPMVSDCYALQFIGDFQVGLVITLVKQVTNNQLRYFCLTIWAQKFLWRATLLQKIFEIFDQSNIIKSTFTIQHSSTFICHLQKAELSRGEFAGCTWHYLDIVVFVWLHWIFGGTLSSLKRITGKLG